MILLGVNIDHAATLRQARYRNAAAKAGGMIEPDPVLIAQMSERAGADGITVHLREDRRHIQENDVRRLRECIASRLNLEMACTPAMVSFALAVKPDSVCLVPESRAEVTTEGGLDVAGAIDRVREAVTAMTAAGIATSLFIDPDDRQIDAAEETGAAWIELHTGAYANASAAAGQGEAGAREMLRLKVAAVRAFEAGLVVNAGHGINYRNIAEVRMIPHLHELNIGHSILSRALFSGIEEAVREMKRLIRG